MVCSSTVKENRTRACGFGSNLGLQSRQRLFRLRTVVGDEGAETFDITGIGNPGVHIGTVHEIAEGFKQWTAVFVHDLGPFADNIRPGQAVVDMVEKFLGHGQ